MDWTFFLTSMVVMNVLVLVLCLLSYFSRKLLLNYGICQIDIKNEKKIDILGGNSLLTSLFTSKIFIPSACGGKGSCGYCKLKINSGAGDVLATEEMVLSRSEINEKYRLACQVRIKKDIKIEIPAEYLSIKEYTSEITKTEKMSPQIRKITCKLIEPNKMKFKAGQYIQIVKDENGEAVLRGYSMANSPEQNDIVELNVMNVEGGIMSPYLHSLEVGTKLTFSGPYGEFFLQENTSRTVVCIAGGVGLAPMKSIIKYMIDNKSKREIYLFYGARNTTYLYDHDQLSMWAEQNKNFHYLPALSDRDIGEEWKGAKGFVTTVFQDNFPDKTDAEAYVCGPPVMIEALMPYLHAKDITDDDIYYDKF